MFDMQKIGRRISALRRSRSMTQTELAERLGISFQAVSSWERGNAMPDIAKLPELAKMFNVTIDWLLGSPDEIADEPLSGVDQAPVMTSAEKKTAVPAGETVVALPENQAMIPMDKTQQEEKDQMLLEVEEMKELSQYLPSETLLQVALHVLDSADAESVNEMMAVILGQMEEEEVDELAENMLRRGMNMYGLLPYMSGEKIDEMAEKQLAVAGVQSINELIPFLSAEKIGELAHKLLETGEAEGLSGLLPFMDEDDVDALAEKLTEKGMPMDNLLPFMSAEKVGELSIKQFALAGVAGITNLLPFMDEDDVGALAIKMLEHGDEVSSLVPFMDSEDLMKLAEKDCAKNGRRMLTKYAPFMDEDDLAELVRKLYLQK